ncbi:hypothetical protein F4679DRAFT_97408 [Xylaria curta]|nr:hypothetical protein F4679DRAFT_97408 [Xylaria curta]
MYSLNPSRIAPSAPASLQCHHRRRDRPMSRSKKTLRLCIASLRQKPTSLLLTASSRPPDGPLLALFVCFLLTIVVDVGGGLTAALEVRLLENAVCRAHYRVADPSVIGPPLATPRLLKPAASSLQRTTVRAMRRHGCGRLSSAVVYIHV